MICGDNQSIMLATRGGGGLRSQNKGEYIGKANTKNVSGCWFPRASPLFLCAMKRCPIVAKIAGSIGILPCCVLNDVFT